MGKTLRRGVTGKERWEGVVGELGGVSQSVIALSRRGRGDGGGR